MDEVRASIAEREGAPQAGERLTAPGPRTRHRVQDVVAAAGTGRRSGPGRPADRPDRDGEGSVIDTVAGAQRGNRPGPTMGVPERV